MAAFCLFLNNPATTIIYTLSLHDALPICFKLAIGRRVGHHSNARLEVARDLKARTEEHTTELQSLRHVVWRHLLETKKTTKTDFGLSAKARDCSRII